MISNLLVVVEDSDTPIGLNKTLAVLGRDLVNLGKVFVGELVVLEVGFNALV